MDEMPPGYRFYPTEEELICFYLQKKLQSSSTPDLNRVIPLLHIYDFNPWDLPQYAGELCHGDPEQWFFFNARQEKEAKGGRPNRLTTTGYWKATGSPSFVYSKDSKIIGLKRTMVFYKGRAPSGRKTQWKMNEYRAIDFKDQQQLASSSNSAAPKFRMEMSLCRVYIKSKCLRAFDRRPSAGPQPMIGEASTSTTHQAHGTTTTAAATPYTSTTTFTSHNQNPTLTTTDIITSSPDNNNTSSSGGATPMETDDTTVVNSEPLWDLDQVDWFLNSTD